MKRSIILEAAGTVYSSNQRDPGTSPYPWVNTPSLELHQIWSKAAGESHGVWPNYAYGWGGWVGIQPAEHYVSFKPGPTLTRFTKVIVRTGFDRSATRGEYYDPSALPWLFPPNGGPPWMNIVMRNRAQAGYLSIGSIVHSEGDGHYVNINSIDGFLLAETTVEMTAHPEGGPFVLEDINNLVMGVVLYAASPSISTDGRAFHKLRCPFFQVELEVEDLGGYVENVRAVSSLALRMMRRARNVVTPKTFIDQAPSGLGERVYMSHPRGPNIGGGGWGSRRLERRPGMILKRTYSPEEFKVEDEVFDMSAYACLGWAAYRIDAPWNPELQGIALVDKGRGFVHARAQDAWSPRPGDGALCRVIEGYPTVSFNGLAIQGGGDESICLRNYDLQQSGWTTAGASGSFTASADTTVWAVEEQGYLSSCRLNYGAGTGTGGRVRSLGTLPYADGDFLHVRVIIKNTSVPSPGTQNGEWYLKRSGGGLPADEFWDNLTRTWETTPTFNAIPSDEPFGEVVVDAIPCDAGAASSDPSYTIGIGRFSAAMGPVTLHGALVDVQHSDNTVAGARTPLVTLDVPITREADTHTMSHAVAGRELWDHQRGTAMIEVQPFWRAVSLPADAVKPLLHALHDVNTWDALQFVPKTGTDDIIRFERAIDGEGTYQLDCPITGIDLTRAHVLRAWVRWLGSDGWSHYGPYSVEVGYGVFLESDGSLVGTSSILGRMTSETAVPSAREHLAIGCDASRQLDGYVRMWETRRNPLHGLECVWKL